MRTGISLILMLAIQLATGSGLAGTKIELGGTWAFQLDPANQGIEKQW